MVELDLSGEKDESKLEIKPKSGLYDVLTDYQLEQLENEGLLQIHQVYKESEFNTKYYKRMEERNLKGGYDST